MLSARLRRVREELGLSQRELAGRLDITGAAWQHYETGKNIPGGAVLRALGELGIDLNWLLLGLGNMRRSRHQGGPRPQSTSRAADPAWLDDWGLKEVAQVASTSNLAAEAFISSSLAKCFPDFLSVSELVAASKQERLECSPEDLRATLTVLEIRGLVEAKEGEPGRYRFVQSGGVITARDDTSQAGVTMMAVRRLVEDIAPALKHRNARILSFEATVEATQASGIVEKLRNLVVRECGPLNQNGSSDKLVVVLGAGIIVGDSRRGKKGAKKVVDQS